MQISARNKLKGTVRSVKLGTQEGSEVMVVIKATEVMIATAA